MYNSIIFPGFLNGDFTQNSTVKNPFHSETAKKGDVPRGNFSNYL